MSGVGFWELVLVFLIGLVVLGPERLPRVAHQLGTWLGQARRMTRMMKRQLEEELDLERELNIRPKPRPVLPRTTPPAPDVAKDDMAKDDRHSAAHEPGATGTGVGSDDESRHEQTGGGDESRHDQPGGGDEPAGNPGSTEPRVQNRVS